MELGYDLVSGVNGLAFALRGGINQVFIGPRLIMMMITIVQPNNPDISDIQMNIYLWVPYPNRVGSCRQASAKRGVYFTSHRSLFPRNTGRQWLLLSSEGSQK